MQSGAFGATLLAFTLALGATARADIVTVDSLAALTDASPLVVEATVAKAEQRNGREYLLSLEVHQALKGSAGKHLVLAAGDGKLVGQRGLFFATAPRPVSTTDCYGVHHKLPWVGRALTGDPSLWWLPRRDFGVHRGREAIVAAVRTRARGPAAHRVVAVPVPSQTPLHAQHGERMLGGLLVRVPADRELERWLLAQIDGDDPARRVQAILLLEPFESVANIERLLALLDDESHVVDGDGTRRYWVRHAARQILERWEVPLPEGPPTVVDGG